MKIKWLGHASFLIISDSGIRILTDPYEPIMGMKYKEIKESADIVSVSHEHGDHNNVKAVKGSPRVLKGATAGEVKGIEFSGVETAHDESGGKERGGNTVFCFEVDRIKLCHLGDLGHMLTEEQIKRIGRVDILMVPVGGNFTIDGRMADAVIKNLKPSVVIPMHFNNDRCPEFPVAGVEAFTGGKKNVDMEKSSEAEYTADGLPPDTRIVVLKPAL